MKLLTLIVTSFITLAAWGKGISTHVLDLHSGKGGTGIAVTLEVKEKSGWKKLSSGNTDENGRIKVFPNDPKIAPGTYRLTFDLGKFYGGKSTFFPEAIVTFNVESSEQHYHVPLVLSPYGYSTYRGN